MRKLFECFLRLQIRWSRELGRGRDADNTYRLIGKVFAAMERADRAERRA
jgi:hypothetical protein